MILQKRRYNFTGVKRVIYKSLIQDKRCSFYDLSQIKPQNRLGKSPILQIYDRDDNIGNFLPVLGIRKMLEFTPDSWNIHDNKIDFDFINNNYQGLIIGGAGLLCPPFKNFWIEFLNQCKLPTIIWGVGSGLGARIGEKINKSKQDNSDQEYLKVVSKISQRCDLVNVRDRLTVEYFELHNANISACPTIVYMQNYKQYFNNDSKTVLYSSHHFDSKDEIRQIKNDINKIYGNFQFTDNVQHPYIGLTEIIKNYYINSNLVVTTRLHGAIMAYSLGIPYVGITRGEKIRSFCKEYGNGMLVQNISELKSTLEKISVNSISIQPIALDSVLDFGNRAKQWVSSVTKLTL